MSTVHVRDVGEKDRIWIRETLVERWGALRIVTRGRLHYPDRLEGFVAEDGEERVGLLTYHVEDGGMEVVALAALVRRRGIGKALVDAARQRAAERDCRRLWLVTTNDNEPAQAFYEAVGFQRIAVHEGGVEAARRLKPEIPRYGVGDVEIRDEWEYELPL
jgi:ribosomal protein S18 acetylase RimI-like enzyme